MKKTFIVFLALIGILLTPMTLTFCANNFSNFEFYIYTTHPCKECYTYLLFQEEVQRLQGYGKVVIFYLEDGNNALYYGRIIDLISSERYYSPLIGVFENGRLIAIIQGILPEITWERILMGDHDEVCIYIQGESNSTKILQGQETIKSLTSLFTRDDLAVLSTNYHLSFFPLLGLIAITAAADALNPCEFYIIAVLLTLVLFRIGRKDVLKIGLSFIAAIFTGYYLLGLGLLKILEQFPQLKYGIISISLIIGTLEILEFFGERIKLIPQTFSERISIRLEKALSIPTAFIAGLFVSILLLPCTSAPYFIVLNLISEGTTLFEGLIILVFYNIIIILPLLIITLAVYTLTYTTLGLKMWISKKRKWLNLFTGITMLILCFLIAALEKNFYV